ncbi:hypothetical protein GGR57DRAFT_512795 [Xylariaceae sp. FL1272]|nr:hypothetical protein GGR57DRAFT_512795 [Xylariaceae sp. FL1272]
MDSREARARALRDSNQEFNSKVKNPLRQWLYAFTFVHVNCDGNLRTYGRSSSRFNGHPESSPNCSETLPRWGLPLNVLGYDSWPCCTNLQSENEPEDTQALTKPTPTAEADFVQSITNQIQNHAKHVYSLKHPRRENPPNVQIQRMSIVWGKRDSADEPHDDRITPKHLALARLRDRHHSILVEFKTVLDETNQPASPTERKRDSVMHSIDETFAQVDFEFEEG